MQDAQNRHEMHIIIGYWYSKMRLTAPTVMLCVMCLVNFIMLHCSFLRSLCVLAIILFIHLFIFSPLLTYRL